MDARDRHDGRGGPWPATITRAAAELLQPGDLLLEEVPAEQLDVGGRLAGRVFRPAMNVRGIQPVRRGAWQKLRVAPRRLRLVGNLGGRDVAYELPARASVAFLAG